MTECQGCGAWNDTRRTVCVLCGTPLAETDEWDAAAELPPLPPLPDGGLRASMPTWLREPLGAGEGTAPRPGELPPISAIDVGSPLGPRADPRSFLTDDDFPQWLRDLAARRAEGERSPTETASTPPRRESSPRNSAPPSGWPGSAELPSSSAATAEPEPVPTARPPVSAGGPAPASAPEGVPPAVVTAREQRRGREPWETLLLVALFIGVVAAALWALVANGVLGPGP